MIQIGKKVYKNYEDFEKQLTALLTRDQQSIMDRQGEPGRGIALDLFAQDFDAAGDGRVREAFGLDDFGALMTSNLSRSIMKGAAAEPAYWNSFSRTRTGVVKTKAINPILLGSFKEYKKNTGQADPTNVTKFSVADGISYDMDIYDAEFNISLIAEANDDLGSFLGTASRFGAGATLTLNLFTRRLIEGLDTDDSTEITAKFNTTSIGSATKLYDTGGQNVHKNYLGNTKALTPDNIKDAISLLEGQRDIDGNPINNSAKFLVVDKKDRLTAQAIIGSDKLVSTDAAKTPANNPVFSQLQVMPVQGIARNSGKAWYIVSDPNSSDVIELAFFRDRSAPVLLAEPDNAGKSFEQLIRRWKAWLLFGGHALNPRCFVGANFA